MHFTRMNRPEGGKNGPDRERRRAIIRTISTESAGQTRPVSMCQPTPSVRSSHLPNRQLGGTLSSAAFTLPQLSKLLDVQYRTLHSWVERGLLEPSVQKSRGTGTRNLFDE